MSVALESVGGGGLRVHGELTFATVIDALERSRPLLAQAQGDLCVDLSAVERADSAGIVLLLEWMRMAAARGVSIGFCGVPAQMLSIARVSDLETVLPIRPVPGP